MFKNKTRKFLKKVYYTKIVINHQSLLLEVYKEMPNVNGRNSVTYKSHRQKSEINRKYLNKFILKNLQLNCIRFIKRS